MKTVKLLVIAAVLAVSPACKKKDKTEPQAGSGSGSATEMMGSGSGSSAMGSNDATGSNAMGSNAMGSGAAPAEDTADWIKVHATHVAPNPNDPVVVSFEKFKVVKASFDPKNLEGATATLEIDLSSLKSGDPKRDGHLNTPDYFDTAKFATATVDVSNVKKKDDKTYTADAKVSLHGVEKTLPVEFTVADMKDDWVRIKAEHKFSRLDFKIGKEPNTETDMKKMDPKKDSAQADVTVMMQLTLKKT